MSKLMTQAEFDAVLPLLRMSPERLESARLRLVDGLTLQAAGDCRPGADPYSRQAVADAVKIVLRARHTLDELQEQHKGAGAIPAGWERVTLVAPADLADEFRKRTAQAAAELPSLKRSKRATAGAVVQHKVNHRPSADDKSAPRGAKA